MGRMDNIKNVVFGFVLIICVILGIAFVASSYKVVDPGNRGVRVTLGSVDTGLLQEGIHFKAPFITKIDEVSIRKIRVSFTTSCYSSDLQQVDARLAVVYSVPESNVITIYRSYAGDPFSQFVQPLVQESFKEVTATRSAERIVKEREIVKNEALASLKRKIAGLVEIHDVVIENLDLSDQLEKAIESKMVQQQEAARAEFAQQQAQIEAKTAQIRAEGEANAIRTRGEALLQYPNMVSFLIVEKWDGKSPSTIVLDSASTAASVILPVGKQ